MPSTKRGCAHLSLWGLLAVGMLRAATAHAGDAPAWMHAQVSAPLPPHDEKTNAVVLFEESVVTVQPNGKIKRVDRTAIKILRPDGESFGIQHLFYGPENPITDVHAWCIPASGKDYEVKSRDIFDSVADIDGSTLVDDERMKTMRIPDAVVGSIVGYEVEQELHLFIALDDWYFQQNIPVREARYTLQLPGNWHYQTNWVNHAAVEPATSGANQWTWTLHDIAAIHEESHMPPWRGLAAKMAVGLGTTGSNAGIQSWSELGAWQAKLASGRRDPSPAIKQKVAELTAPLGNSLAKMQALAGFVQSQIRYVAIELGIGGFQPHPAVEVFTHRYGDCKDKATLLSSMLKEIGIESYYVIINAERGAVSAATPPNLEFNHVILAIALPPDVDTKTLSARIAHPKLGQVLFFDPTNEVTPFGNLPGYLQANYGLLVAGEGGELLELPRMPADGNGLTRVAKMTLDDSGTLHGEVQESRVGGRAAQQRYALRAATVDTDKIKPIESMAAASLTDFEILKATVRNARAPELPFEWQYTLEAAKYAKKAGDLLLVRPRVVGKEALGFLETKEPRANSIEFEELERDSDTVEITLPPGYVVDELPPPLNLDEPYASYHSKAVFKDGVLTYTRVFELKKLSLPAGAAIELRDFYRTISGDERNSAVFKRAGT